MPLLFDVVDLPMGATPLDFAYHIHSMVGHRCGAKVAGRVFVYSWWRWAIRLRSSLKRNPDTSDWLNQTTGFVHSSRARAKNRAGSALRVVRKTSKPDEISYEVELGRVGATLKMLSNTR